MILGIAFANHKKAAFGRYHLVEAQDPYTTAQACTAWDHLPLEHAGIPVDEAAGGFYFRAACGAELPHTRLDARWVDGSQVTCHACQRLAPQGPPPPRQLSLLDDDARTTHGEP